MILDCPGIPKREIELGGVTGLCAACDLCGKICWLDDPAALRAPQGQLVCAGHTEKRIRPRLGRWTKVDPEDAPYE